MSLLTQFLDEPASRVSPHPRIHAWAWLLSQRQGKAHCRIERRRQGLTYLPTKLWLELTMSSGEPKAESSDWDSELNDWLIQQKIRAVSEENEAVRFHLMLRELLQKIETRLGDGYFSAVLIDVLKKTGLAAQPRLAFVLSKVGRSSPSPGAAYAPAAENIKAAFSACARSLTELGYEEDVVLHILVECIAAFLDDRFSVTNRRILGMD